MKNIKYIVIMTIITLLISTQSFAQKMSEDGYKKAVLSLFDEFMMMVNEGVFLDPRTVKLITDANIKLPNTIRGDNPPGGYFARPPGSEWLNRVEALRNTGHKVVCFDIPKMPSDTGICGFDLMSLKMGALDDDYIGFLDGVVAKFWLANICSRSPEACSPYITE